MKIDFLILNDIDFEFTDLYNESKSETPDFNKVKSYPLEHLRYFFQNKETIQKFYPLNETEISSESFANFKNIFVRGDYFYLIAFHYFKNVGDYSYDDKTEGIIRVDEGNGFANQSFFQMLYVFLLELKEKSMIQLRHEYLVIRQKYNYTNLLLSKLFNDYEDLNIAIRRETNVFAKYGEIIKEIYLIVFRDFYSNFVDYLSDENFKKLKETVYPSTKEIQSFKFANRKNWKYTDNQDAVSMVINSMLNSLKEDGFIAAETTYEQFYDLFNNRRREYGKINWLKDLTAMKTFYKILEDNKIVEDTQNRHWKIFADYFLVKNSIIDPEEIKKKKYSTDNDLTEKLNKSVNFVISKLNS